MLKARYLIAGFTSATVIAAGSIGAIVSADSPTTTNSPIPHSVIRSDRLTAESQVLNTSTDNIRSAMKDKTIKTLITNAGYTRSSFEQKVKSILDSELQNQGYSSTDIANLRHQKHDEQHQLSRKDDRSS